jgi:hypothetical protein
MWPQWRCASAAAVHVNVPYLWWPSGMQAYPQGTCIYKTSNLPDVGLPPAYNATAGENITWCASVSFPSFHPKTDSALARLPLSNTVRVV